MKTYSAFALLCSAVHAVQLHQHNAGSGYDILSNDLRTPVVEQTDPQYLSHMTIGKWNRLSSEEAFAAYQKKVYAANMYYEKFSQLEGVLEKEKANVDHA